MICLKPKVRHTLASPMRLYERNFTRLHLLLPDLRGVGEVLVAQIEPELTVSVKRLDVGPYTSTILLECLLAIEDQWVTDPAIRVRLYHDARVAEVVGYQNHHRFAARYDYPNRFMYQRNEKMQLNLFLSEFIDFLCKRNARFLAEA